MKKESHEHDDYAKACGGAASGFFLLNSNENSQFQFVSQHLYLEQALIDTIGLNAMAMENDDEIGFPIEVHVYDLSKGMAKMMSGSLVGRTIDGIWYSGIVAYGREYFFSRAGVESCGQGGTVLGEPVQVESVGETYIPYSVFLDFILTLGEAKYRPGQYDIRQLNSNHFSEEVAQFLCGVHIPKYVFDDFEDLINTSLGAEVLPLLDRISLRDNEPEGISFRRRSLTDYIPQAPRDHHESSPDYIELQRQIDALRADQLSLQERRSQSLSKCRKLPRPHKKDKDAKKRKKKRSRSEAPSKTSCDQTKRVVKRVTFAETPVIIEVIDYFDDDLVSEEEDDPPDLEEIRVYRCSTPPPSKCLLTDGIMSEEQQDAIQAPPPEAGEGAVPEAPKKPQKPREPPITFREFDHTKDFEDLVKSIVTLVDPEEQDRLREMEDWIIKNEGTWVLAEGYNAFLGRVLHDKTLPSEGRVAMLRLLAYGAAQDDLVLILHMDRKDHVIMNYAQEFDRLPIQEQEALALFFCNLFETNSASEWLLYISEWSQGTHHDLSNIRVTTKVAVNALLGDTPTLQEYGTALMYNLSTKEVFDDICAELAMALLQYFQGKPSEEHVFRCMKALNKFCSIAHREVPQLVKMIGPEPSKFSGMSSRIDEFIEMINARLATVPSF